MYNYSEQEIKQLLHDLGGIPYPHLDNNKQKHHCSNCGHTKSKTFRFTEKYCLVCTKCELNNFTHWFTFLADKLNQNGKEANKTFLKHIGKWNENYAIKPKVSRSIDVQNFQQFSPPTNDAWNKQSLINRPNKLVLTNIYEWRYPDNSLYGYVTRKDFTDSKLPMQIVYGQSELGIGWHQINTALPNRPIFNSHNYSKDKKILFVEGERNCIEVQKVLSDDWCVLTIVGGSATSYTANSDFSFIDKDQEMYCWPDNDLDGTKYATALTVELPNIKTIDIKPHLPTNAKKGYDLHDAIQEGWSKEDIINALNSKYIILEPSKHIASKIKKIENQNIKDSNLHQEIKLSAKEEFLKHIRPQGMKDSNCVLYPKRKKTIVEYSDSKLSKTAIIGMSSKEIAMKAFPAFNDKQEIIGIDLDAAVDFIMQQCSDKGIFSSDNIRGIGIYHDKERIVINTGNKIICNFEEEFSFDEFKTEFIYQDHGKDLIWFTEDATKQDLQTILSLCSCLAWADPLAKVLYGGFITQAILNPLYPWLSHLWLHGLQGNGKTTVQKTTEKILGPLCLSVRGSTTEAGIRQEIGDNNFCVSFDEAEITSQEDEKRIKSILALARQATDDGRTLKGTASGKGMSFNVKVPFILSSIDYFLEQDSDRNRFALLELNVPTEDHIDGGEIYEEYQNALAQVNNEFTQRIITYCYKRSRDVISWMPIVKAKLRLKGFNQRMSDQYGGLITGMLIWSEDIFKCNTPTELDLFITEFINAFTNSLFDIKSELLLETNDSEMLKTILNSHIRIEDKELKQRYVSIQRALKITETLYEREFDTRYVKEILNTYGLKLSNKKVFIQCKNKNLSKLIGCNNWIAALKSVKGASITTTSFGSAMKYKCLQLPIYDFLDIDETKMLM